MSILTDNEHGDGLVGDINMTPLIDVMLVLLIIFIVTLPVMNHALKLDLPKEVAAKDSTKDDAVDISVDISGAIFWNKVALTDSQLANKATEAASSAQPPTVRIYADRHVEYERVLHVMSIAQAAGLTNLEFVTAPTSMQAGRQN
ncbi:ExbD/TolR family protein [Paraburkholderia caribensis]|uniref:ExbD/TolR family protein n=1 Tax=Paraburkholderia caribensis TaxID=75105 RepID=UPI0007228327|nr:biopolymer transporter ExbD [Paraburkholderia caribensis]ALP68498.1 biopolymer transporter ExbD [Paraburkholderia caribensis]AUT57852.1 biopolymer transporter ExbD [Paraburkholderia caribensis]